MRSWLLRRLGTVQCVSLPLTRAVSSCAVELTFEKYEVEAVKESPPLVILHGLFGHKRNWHSVSKALSKRLKTTVFAVDLRNHGHFFLLSVIGFSSSLVGFCDLQVEIIFFLFLNHFFLKVEIFGIVIIFR